MPMPAEISKTGSGSTPPMELAATWWKVKIAHEAASLENLMQARASTQRLVHLNQNKAFGLKPDAGLQEAETMRGGGVHIGDVIIQQPGRSPEPTALPAVLESTSSGSTLGKLAIAGALALGGAGAGLGAWQALRPEEPPPVVELPADRDTIGILEPDR